MKLPNPPMWMMVGGLSLAGVAGAGTAVAITSSASQEPGRTVTIQVGATGPAGPAGPQGEPGPAGVACPTGYSEGRLVFNAPGGQVAIWTCLE